MTESCTFCRIVKNQMPASRVYEDERTMAFLDIRPANEGHTLVVPKNHHENIHEIPDEELAYLFKIVKKVAEGVKKGVNADGISLFQNNGTAAGQVVFHIHVHIVPRFDEKKTWQRRDASKQELDRIAERIRKHLTL